MAVAVRPPARARRLTSGVPRPPAPAVFGAALTAVLVAIGLRGGGGTALAPTTTVEICLLLGGGLLACGAVLAHDRRPLHGATAVVLFAVLAALTATSILWAVEPSEAWLEANRTLAYLAVFTAGVALAREAGSLWNPLLGAVLAFSAIVCGFAVLTKILPGVLNPDEVYARLREPYDYWNAVGLTAAMGLPLALWLGARRHGHAGLSALAYPIVGLQVVTMLLAYSRGSLLAAAAGLALWFAVVPLRLRGAVVLLVGLAGALPLTAWAFSQDGLTEDRVALAARETAGLELGLAVVATLALLLAAGLAIGFAAARRSPSAQTRRTAGIVLLVGLALVPVAVAGRLALSDRGLGGSVSHAWTSLTDPDARTPANTPDRLTAVGSVRAAYWDQALKVWADHRLAGAGAGAYPTVRRRYRQDELVVRQAHGYGVQTAADLGLAGIAANLALLAAWLAAALASLRLVGRARRGAHWTAERVGLATLLAVVVTFGVHSFIDWTYFTPGVAVAALLCAGFLAGRGPGVAADARALPARLRGGLRSPGRAAAAAGVVVLAAVCAFAAWQPLRSVQAAEDAVDVIAERGPAGSGEARALAQTARDRNPLAVDPLFALATVETVSGRKDAARAALEDAVSLQPDNPETWVRAAEFALRQDRKPQRAVDLLGPALYLDPRSDQAQALYVAAAREAGGVAGNAGSVGTPPPAGP
jgi:tetratricopeptide (TPR) repeat protein